jgi:hypothetical protein
MSAALELGESVGQAVACRALGVVTRQNNNLFSNQADAQVLNGP